jgi:hypothetical protein
MQMHTYERWNAFRAVIDKLVSNHQNGARNANSVER